MRRARIRIAALLVLALLANSLVVVPAAPASGGSGLWQRLSGAVTRLVGSSSAEAAQAAPAPQRVEVPRLRTRNSRTYTTPEGNLEAVISAGPINYQDSGGAWRPIDSTLVATSTPGQGWENKAGRYRVLLPPNLAAPVRIQRGQAWLSFKLVGAAPTQGTVSGNTVTYRDVLPGVTISLSAVGDELKEQIVLANASVPTSYSFQVQTSPGLSFKANGAGGLDLYQDTEFQFALPAPFMTDASNTVEGFSPAVSFHTSPTPGGISLQVAADPAWLQSPRRQWPVTIDPTVTLTGPAVNADCHIVGGNYQNQSFCASTELEVGTYSTGNRHGLLYFPVEPALPRDSQVLTGTLSLYVPRAATNGALTVGLRRLTNPFTKDATWIKRNATTNWTTPGGDYSSTTQDTVSAGAAAGWVDLSAPALVQGWVNGELRNDGFLLRRQVEDASNFLVRFVSRNHTNSSLWPTLTINYVPRLGKRGAYSYDTKGLSDRGELDVNVANGNLVVGATDFNLAGIGLGLVVNRTYNGLAAPHVRSVGRAWNLSLGADIHLTQFPSGPVELHGTSGESVPFIPKVSDPNSYSVPAGTNATMTKAVSGSTTTYTLTWRKSGEVWTLSRTGSLYAKLDRQEDRNGNRLTYSYDPSGRLSKVEQLRRGQAAGTGRTVTASYVGTSALIDKLTDSSGRVVDYGYSGNELTSVTDADNKTVQYAYTGDTLTRITDARNNPIDIGYETGGTRRVASVTRVTAGADPDPKTSYAYTDFASGTCKAGGPTGLFATTQLTDANNKTTTYKYDGRDRVCRTTDPLGHTHDREYDTADNVTSTSDALTKTSSFGFTTTADGISNLTSITGSGGARTSFSYGDVDNPYQPDTKTDGSGNKTTYSYAAPGNLMGAQDTTTGGTGANTTVTRNSDGTVATATDANNHTTTYSYTYTSGLLTKVVTTPPSGSVLGATTTNFDSLQRPSSVVDGKGQTRSLTYDPIDRLKTQTIGSTLVKNTYDANGNLAQLSDPTGTTTLTHDELNRTLTKAAPSRTTITYSYDGVGNLKTLDDAGGTVTYRYDSANRVDQLTEPGNEITGFGYDHADRRTSTTYPNGVAVTLGYDDDGRQTSVKAVKNTATIVDLKYCYAKVAITDTTACSPGQNNPTDTRYKLTDSRTGATTNYAYDTQGRLTQAKTTVGGSDDFQYAYDKAGNRTKQVIDGGTPTFYGYGTANELCWSKQTTTDPGSSCTTPSGATTYSHDGNGNLNGSSAGFAATYNVFDQATSITGAGGSTLSPMTYGGSDQSERRRAGGINFTVSALGLQVAAPTSGGTGTFYTRDPSGNLISQRTPSGIHYYILDGLGSVVALTKDTDGSVVGRYSYEPYGKPTHSGTVTSAFQFAGGYYDSQTKLVKFGVRYHDPALARWTQQDPLEGRLTSPRSLDRYAYAEDDPVNQVDRLGTQTTPAICFIQFAMCVDDANAWLITCESTWIITPVWACQFFYRIWLISCKQQLDACLASCYYG